MQPSLDTLLLENALLKSRLEAAQTRIQELEERVNLNSKNSSRPPSSDYKKQKKSETSKGGAQKGHPPHVRQPIEKVDRKITCSMDTCPFCGDTHLKPLPKTSSHQQVELRNNKLEVTQYQCPFYQCETCKKKKAAPLPAGISRSNFGPRLTAAIALMTGSFHLSKREVPALLKQLFGMHISSGSISNIEKRISQALEPCYQEIRKQAQVSTDCHYVDETSWRDRGVNHTLWLLSTEALAYYRIDRHRNRQACNILLGNKLSHPIVTDRYGVYNHLTGPHQYCLSHLLRDFQRISERPGLQGVIGRGLVKELRQIFAIWRDYTCQSIDRQTLKRRSYYRRKELKQWLWDGWLSGFPKLEKFCERMLKSFDCLWTYLRVKDMEPHNNRAERDLRSLVLWRKKSFGTKSQTGQRFVERISSVIKTLVKQGKNVLDFTSTCLHSGISNRKFPLIFSN